MPDISVVMAAFNEEASIRAAVSDVVGYVFPVTPKAELIVVNDGSRDRTGALLDEMADADLRIRVLHQSNAGHGPALIAGLSAARGGTIVILDSDRQIMLDDFSDVWALYRKHDAVLGVRAVREDNALRRGTSLIMRKLLLLLFGPIPADPNIPLKIVPRRAWEAASAAIGPDNLIPSALLAVHMKLSGMTVAERAVVHRSREGSVSNFRGAKLARFCLAALLTILRFRFNGHIRQLIASHAERPKQA
jgi:dolichol-phosphate mannosyltransferase